MASDYCPACAVGPAENAHNGRGVYCSRDSLTLKRKLSLYKRVLRFISGRDDYLVPVRDPLGYIIGSATITENANGLEVKGHILDSQFVNELKKNSIASISIWGRDEKEKTDG